MAPQTIHLPDGQTFIVTPVFAGVGFKSHELNMHPHAFPVGWTVVLQTEDSDRDHISSQDGNANRPSATEESTNDKDESTRPPKKHIHAWKTPTLRHDSLFISSIANPSNTEYKPAASPTRQIAMMLWVSLYWYFHQTEPSPHISDASTKHLPEKARPKGEWKIHIKKEGVLRGRNLIPKLERMGLIASGDSAVGTNMDDGGDTWATMFVSRKMFWQVPARLFLFTLQPARALPSSPGTPFGSRASSPIRGESPHGHTRQSSSQSPFPGHSSMDNDVPGAPVPMTLNLPPGFPVGPYYSTSHLPTYFPPAPLLYTMTNGIRHPFRPKPPRMGEIFYNRFVPSNGQYLSFRVASIAPTPVPYLGPMGPKPQEHTHLCNLSDTTLLQQWMANPRVKAFWGGYTPDFLQNVLSSKHSFPVIGMWDGVPFGYFEIYWVKEDILGKHIGLESSDWDRGLHVLVGEEWSRGRVYSWLTSLVHWCFCADFRTMSICLEPRVDNQRFLDRLKDSGFAREHQVSFPHKQSWLYRMRRESWEGPSL